MKLHTELKGHLPFLLAKLKEIALEQRHRADKEMDHGDADDALLQFIGEEEVLEAYDSIDK